jgi:hypothetical protein
MDNFWKWLKKANAQAVFFCLLAALAGVTAWWAWKLMTPLRADLTAVTAPAREQAAPGIGILACLREQQSARTNRAASLFIPPAAFAQIPTSSRPPEKPAGTAPPPKPETRGVPVNPPAERAKKTVTLTYRGMVMRRDGVPMAYVADSRTRRAAFYAAGSRFFGMELKRMEAETLEVILPDHSSATLKRGAPQSFPEEEHGK